jgi:hypothetical protein
MITGFAVIMMVCSAPPIVAYLCTGNMPHDYSVWFETGQKMLRGEELYPRGQGFPFMYPPLAAFLLAPLVIFGEVPFISALVLINSAAWAASLLLSVYLVTGKMLRQAPLLYLLPVLCTLPYTWDTYFLGQPNLILLALMLGAFACLRNRHEWGAGALVALAAAIKAFPVMAVAYFVYRQHFKALFASLLSLAAFFVAVPVVLRGVEQGTHDVTTWTGGMLLNYDQDNIGQRSCRAYSWKNQSLIGLANRLLRHKGANGESGDTGEYKSNNFYVNFLDLDFSTTNLVIVVIALGLCLCCLAMMPPYSLRTPSSDAIEYAIVLIFVLFFSPYSFRYFYVWLLYPFTVMVHRWLSAQKPSLEAGFLRAAFLVILALLALSLVFHPLFTRPLADAYGNVFLACLILFGTLAWQLAKFKSVPGVRRITAQGRCSAS